MKVLQVGAGLIGQERISALLKISKDYSIDIDIYVVDTNSVLLDDVKNNFNINVLDNLSNALKKTYDWVFISTPHSVAAEIALEVFKYQPANVLIEKPLGRNIQECNKIIKFKPKKTNLHVGLNYRFYQGINTMLNHTRKGLFGKIISINMISGHGNSPGMEKSWKLDPVLCGGGCLIDPGVHLLDLALIFSSQEISVKGGSTWKGFWNTGIEEEAHLILESSDGIIFNIQTSLNRWRSHFSIQVNGTKGYGIVQGRGRSYGDQSYTTGKRWAWQSGITQLDSEISHLHKYNGDDSFYECIVALFKLPSWKFPNSQIYPCNEKDGKEVMLLLDKCRKELKLNDSC